MNQCSQLAHFAVQKKLVIAISFALSNIALNAHAEETPDAKPSEPATIELPTIAVTANPLGVGSDEMVVPVSVLKGRELGYRRESTLGETLKNIPGVSASYFGPNVSRPMIRGMDSERVKLMENGMGIMDASSLSFDHAIPLDPLVVEQIDVVRGPAALLYGGSAVGGVVNAIDNRIPSAPLDGVTGRGEVRFGGAESQRNGALVIDGGNGLFAIHGDAYKRKTEDSVIPGFAVSDRKRSADGSLQENKGRLVNSSSDGDGGALGASLTFDHGYIGLSYSTFSNNYGTVAEPDVRVEMLNQRWDIASEWRDLGNIVERVKFKVAHTDYKHQEIAAGTPETLFKNNSIEASFEAKHGNLGPMTGVVISIFEFTL